GAATPTGRAEPPEVAAVRRGLLPADRSPADAEGAYGGRGRRAVRGRPDPRAGTDGRHVRGRADEDERPAPRRRGGPLHELPAPDGLDPGRGQRGGGCRRV